MGEASDPVERETGDQPIIWPWYVRWLAVAYVQGQLQLTPCSRKDLEQVVVVPAAGLAFQGDAEFLWMLLQQRQG